MADLAINHGYVPHGGQVFVNDIARIYEFKYKGKVCTTCSSDVRNAVNYLYTHLYPSLEKQFTIVEQPKTKRRGKA